MLGVPLRNAGAACLIAAVACPPPPADPVDSSAFAFGVFGDGPYFGWEQGRYRRVLDDVNQTPLTWLLHVGDILWYPCSEAAYRERRASLDAVAHPVVYTPGDNEWTDCYEARPGGYEPLDRLQTIRRVFFDAPSQSLGAEPMSLQSQSGDTAFAEFVENRRWGYGGFEFAIIHIVGSEGLAAEPGQSPRYAEEWKRRTAAGIAWMRTTFERARADSATGVVLAWHANPGFGDESEGDAYNDLLMALEAEVATFAGSVLLIHGDWHEYTLDHPLADATGQPYPNFTRLQTFGSPDIGWVRVVIDTVTGAIEAEPRLVRGWGW